jgi:hypothetical protein
VVGREPRSNVLGVICIKLTLDDLLRCRHS